MPGPQKARKAPKNPKGPEPSLKKKAADHGGPKEGKRKKLHVKKAVAGAWRKAKKKIRLTKKAKKEQTKAKAAAPPAREKRPHPKPKPPPGKLKKTARPRPLQPQPKRKRTTRPRPMALHRGQPTRFQKPQKTEKSKASSPVAEEEEGEEDEEEDEQDTAVDHHQQRDTDKVRKWVVKNEEYHDTAPSGEHPLNSEGEPTAPTTQTRSTVISSLSFDENDVRSASHFYARGTETNSYFLRDFSEAFRKGDAFFLKRGESAEKEAIFDVSCCLPRVITYNVHDNYGRMVAVAHPKSGTTLVLENALSGNHLMTLVRRPCSCGLPWCPSGCLYKALVFYPEATTLCGTVEQVRGSGCAYSFKITDSDGEEVTRLNGRSVPCGAWRLFCCWRPRSMSGLKFVMEDDSERVVATVGNEWGCDVLTDIFRNSSPFGIDFPYISRRAELPVPTKVLLLGATFVIEAMFRECSE